MKDKDWENVLKFIAFVIFAAIPFIAWDLIERFSISHQWILFIVFPIIVVISTFCIKAIFALFQDGQWSVTKIAIVILLFLYAIVGIIANFVLISYFSNIWHWSAWIIGILCWIALFLLAVVLFDKLFPEKESHS